MRDSNADVIGRTKRNWRYWIGDLFIPRTSHLIFPPETSIGGRRPQATPELGLLGSLDMHAEFAS